MNKLRHGQEISSEIINQIINEINNLKSEHQDVISDKEEVEEKLSSFSGDLEALKEEYKNKLALLPNFIELVETYYSQLNDGIKWEDMTADNSAGLSAGDKTNFLLFYDSARCFTYRQNPPTNFKTLLFDIPAKIIWFYDKTNLQWISLSSDASGNSIQITPPSISIDEDTSSDTYGNWVIDNVPTGISALGSQGSQGPQGPTGQKGDKGDRGLRGLTGEQGIKGEDGRSIAMISGSCDDTFGNNFIQNSYSKDYLYIKFYYNDMSQEEINNIQPIIIKTKGIAYIPYVEGTKLYFTNNGTIPTSLENGIDIQGPKGDKGNQGDTGIGISDITSVNDADGNTTLTIKLTNNTQKEFTIQRGNQGIQGPKGEDGTSISIVATVSSASNLPSASTVTAGSCYIVEIDEDHDNLLGTLYVSNGSVWSYCGQIKGPKGDTGEDGADGINGNQIYSGAGLPSLNQTQLKIYVGDLYIDSSNYKIYKATAANNDNEKIMDATWSQIVDSFKGDKGDTGHSIYFANCIASTTTTGIDKSVVNPANGATLKKSDLLLDKNSHLFEITDILDTENDHVYIVAYKTSLPSPTVSATELLNNLYPIGSIYMSVTQNEATKNTNGKYGCPIADTLGGTWQKLEDRFLIGKSNTYTTAGGTTTQTLTINNIPSHLHTINVTTNPTLINWNFKARRLEDSNHIIIEGSNIASEDINETQNSAKYNSAEQQLQRISYSKTHTHTISNQKTGYTGQTPPSAFNIMPPYLPVYMWKRVADN